MVTIIHLHHAFKESSTVSSDATDPSPDTLSANISVQVKITM